MVLFFLLERQVRHLRQPLGRSAGEPGLASAEYVPEMP